MASADGSYIRKKATDHCSPHDQDGHSTHMATTIAGSAIVNATFLSYPTGTARGMALQVRLTGMDQEIRDNVDVLSLSSDDSFTTPYHCDTITIGAFAAVERGIFVSCSTGNTRPPSGSLSNVASWIMTVEAGTLDCDFPAYAVLGNRKHFAGVSLYRGEEMGDEPAEEEF